MSTQTPPLKVGRHYFGPVGICIYCGVTEAETPLSSEHILPFSLGGNAELERASCGPCAAITRCIERHCASNIFGDFRLRYGIQTRNPDKRQNIVKIVFEMPSGYVQHEVPIEDAFNALVLPEMSPPRIINHSSPEENLNIQNFMTIFPSDYEKRIERMAPDGALSWSYEVNADWELFARFLAKTALAIAVATIGFNSSSSPLGKIMRQGTADDLAEYIGGFRDQPATTIAISINHEPVSEEITHFGFRLIRHGIVTYLACDLCLYLNNGTPHYLIIIGQVPNDYVIKGVQPRTARLRRKANKNPARDQKAPPSP